MSIEQLPPHSIEMEQLVLGAVLKEEAAIHRVIDVLQPKDSFYNPAHNEIYNICVTLFKEKKPIDVVYVWEILKTKPFVLSTWNIDRAYLSTLTATVTNTSKLEQWVRFIEEKAISRREIDIAQNKIALLYKNDGTDVFDILNDCDNLSYYARKSINSFKNVTPEASALSLLEHVERAMQSEGLIGLDTGIPQLNSITGGPQPGQVWMIGARTRHGKSAVASYFQYHHAKTGQPSVFYSMEMSTNELWARMAAIRLRENGHKIAYSDIFKGNISKQEFELFKKANEECSQLPIYIDDTGGLDTMQIRAKTLQYRNDYGITSAYIDYIQLAKVQKKSGLNHAQGVSENMSEIKGMAKDFQIPFVVLSQVDRDVEKAGRVRRATLADLKDSGGLEEKTDVVILLDRPEARATADDEILEEDRGVIVIDIAKHKMGETGIIKLPFDVATNYFEDEQTMPIYNTQSNFIIRPSRLDDIDDEPPF